MTTTLETYVRKQSGLAVIYIQDGALHSASRVLRALATAVEAAADANDRALADMIKKDDANG